MDDTVEAMIVPLGQSVGMVHQRHQTLSHASQPGWNATCATSTCPARPTSTAASPPAPRSRAYWTMARMPASLVMVA